MERDHRAQTGESRTTHEIVARAPRRAMPNAMATIARYHDRLGARAGVASINLLDPDVIVLGGGMSNLPGLDEAARERDAPARLLGYASRRVSTQRARRLERRARRAAWLWPDPITSGGGPA